VVTVKVEVDPAAMEAGLGEMLTVAASGFVGSVEISAALAPPHPVNANKRESRNNAAKGERIL
jgi:hypothetical protein